MKKMISLAAIACGAILSAAAFGLIVLPLGFSAGGVTGLAVLLCRVSHLRVSAVVLVLNLTLFVLGWYFVGKEFAAKTLLASVLFPMAMELFQRSNALTALAADPLLASLLAGGLLGLGAGLILLGNGSSGGFDILGVILHLKFRIPVALVMYIGDFGVILFQGSTETVLSVAYGIVVILVSSLVINHLLSNTERIQIFAAEPG